MIRILQIVLGVTSLVISSGCQKAETEKANIPYTYLSVTGAGTQKVHYEVQSGFAVTEEDILLGTEAEAIEVRNQMEGKSSRSAISKPLQSDLWEGGTVYYELPSDFLNQNRITEAMRHIQAKARVRFLPRKSELNYIKFKDIEGQCSSNVGRRGGMQTLVLGARCTSGSTIHELLHALGIWHEQSRSDRAQHVKVNLDNIKEGMEHNFQIQTGQKLWGSYDFSSIMHYSAMAFSKNGSPTITRLNGDTTGMGQREGMTDGDIEALQSLYGN